MVEVKIIMVMPLVSDKCVCACIVCSGEAFSTSKKTDEFFHALFLHDITSPKYFYIKIYFYI